jgi:hypothetical protein
MTSLRVEPDEDKLGLLCLSRSKILTGVMRWLNNELADGETTIAGERVCTQPVVETLMEAPPALVIAGAGKCGN